MSEERSRQDRPRRYRNARSDAEVGSIEKRMEKDYGLPRGSIQINRPGGQNARSDKQVGRLRDEYDEE